MPRRCRPLVQGAQSLAVFSPVKDLTGRPLVGNGANAAPGTGQNGAPGGWLLGDGGAGGSRRARHRPGGRQWRSYWAAGLRRDPAAPAASRHSDRGRRGRRRRQ